QAGDMTGAKSSAPAHQTGMIAGPPPRQTATSNQADRRWWIPIAIAIIGLIGVIGAALINRGFPFPISTPSSGTFSYQVRVQSQNNTQNIAGAKVTLEVGGIAPLDEFTDSNGIAQLSIDVARAGKSGRLTVEATGYQQYVQNIDVKQDAL